MRNICLQEMTKDLCRKFLQKFTHDPDLFMDNQPFAEYIYTQEKADAYWQRYQDLHRVHLAVMLAGKPIGEIVLKQIDYEKKECTMGISMQNDSVKNKGYGTQAEQLALAYAFTKLGMETVLADALLKNARSQHVLEKVGFVETHQDTTFRYYCCQRSNWIAPELDDVHTGVLA